MKYETEERQVNRTVVEVGQEFPLKIKRMGINGEGIGYYKQAVVFVPGALTGEEVIVEVTKTHKNYNEAFVKKNPSKVRAARSATLPNL